MRYRIRGETGRRTGDEWDRVFAAATVAGVIFRAGKAILGHGGQPRTRHKNKEDQSIMRKKAAREMASVDIHGHFPLAAAAAMA
jgi:hypothetical protein